MKKRQPGLVFMRKRGRIRKYGQGGLGKVCGERISLKKWQLSARTLVVVSQPARLLAEDDMSLLQIRAEDFDDGKIHLRVAAQDFKERVSCQQRDITRLQASDVDFRGFAADDRAEAQDFSRTNHPQRDGFPPHGNRDFGGARIDDDQFFRRHSILEQPVALRNRRRPLVCGQLLLHVRVDVGVEFIRYCHA